mgnify:CR=1 FL=1
MPPINEPKLISGNANLSLAKGIARRMSMHRGMSVNLVDARVERFNDGEVFVEVFENVRGEDMYIIQPTSSPANDNLMELLIMCDALRRSSADRITAVIPYFGYARQDRRAKARTPITAKLIANMIAEAALILADPNARKPDRAGVLTPALALHSSINWTNWSKFVQLESELDHHGVMHI